MNEEIKYRNYSDLNDKEKAIATELTERYFIRRILNRLNAFGLIAITSFIYSMANDIYLKSTGTLIVVCIITDLYFLYSSDRVAKINRENYRLELQKILQIK